MEPLKYLEFKSENSVQGTASNWWSALYNGQVAIPDISDTQKRKNKNLKPGIHLSRLGDSAEVQI